MTHLEVDDMNGRGHWLRPDQAMAFMKGQSVKESQVELQVESQVGQISQ